MKNLNKFLFLITVFVVGCFSTVNAKDYFAQNNNYIPNTFQSPAKQLQAGGFSAFSQASPSARSQQNAANSQASSFNQPASGFSSQSQIDQFSQSQESSIEKLFSSDINKSSDINPLQLKQVGYDFFLNSVAQGFGKYDGSYTLNIGEKVDVYFWGDSVDMLSISGSQMLSPLTKSQVDSKGNIFVPGVGIVKAEGRSISDVEREIQSLAAQKFTNVKVRITIADSTEFVVFVYGYVNKPGKIAIGANSSIIEALAAAGGVSKNGSLRSISYKSSGKEQNVDLYNTIFLGRDSGIRLKPNDSIFVNHINSAVALKNGVKVPGIYEASSTDSLSNIINYAGGLLPSTDKTIVNVKTYKDGQRKSADVPVADFKTAKLSNGDIIEFRNLYGKAEDFVSLEGNVKHPATFAYKKGMKLSDVLKNKNELQDETFIHQAVIKRISGDGKEVISVPVSLEDFFHGGHNPDLRPQDVITVYKNTNSGFIEVYGCINKPKQVPYNENLTLKDVLADIQFTKSSTQNNNSSSNIYNVNMVSYNDEIIPAYDVAVEITNGESERTIYLYDVLVQNDGIKDITITPGDKIFFRPLRNDEIVKTVKVSGYVNKPGVYKFIDGKRLSDMINIAGGLTKNADLRGVVFKRTSLAQREQDEIRAKNIKDVKQLEGQMAGDTNASKEDTEARQQTIDEITKGNSNLANKHAGRIALNILTNDLNKINNSENIEVQDGDEIYIPRFSNHVMVIGEVYNETSFVYKKGAKASYYIRLVGGYTPNARRTKLYKISSNGRAQKLHLLATNNIEPGDTIIVPRKIRGNDWITPLAGTLQSIASLLTSIFVVTKL